MSSVAGSGPDVAGQRIQQVTTAGVAGLATGAFLLSYDALHQLARTSHVPSMLAWLWPLIVDGFIVVASLAVLQAVHTARRALYPWALVLGFSALSVTFNVLHAPSNLVAQLVAAIPPLALVLSFELLMRQIHHRLHHTAGPDLQTAPVNGPSTGSAGPPSVPQSAHPQPTRRPSPPRERSATPPSGSVKATRSPRAVTLARACEVRAKLNAAGKPLTTAALAEALVISDGYARRLLRDLNDDNGTAHATLGDDLHTARDREVRSSPAQGLRAVSQ